MKVHTSEFKEEIKKLGRQLSSKITYGETELGNEELNSVTPHYESTILKSIMKQLDVDSNVEIPLETIINYQFGVKVGNEYEYLDYGNYVVYKVEKQEDTRSWKITCYDKMLYAMKPYESLGVSFPISIKDYLQAICTKLGLTLASGNFANEDKMIMNELYLDASGNGLDYTFRDVLDEIAQATGSTICINENDELEVRYPKNVGEYETAEGTDLLLENVDDEKDIDYELNGDTTQDGTPTPTTPIEVQTVTGRQEIDVYGKNLIFLKDVSNTLNGLTGTISGNIITINGTNTKTDANWVLVGTGVNLGNSIFPNFKAGESYTLSVNENIKAYMQINYYRGATTTQASLVYLNLETSKNKTFTVPSDFGGVAQFFVGIIRNASDINTTINIQLEKGTIATQYEDFKEQSYEINLGKQLLDLKDGSYSQNGITAVVSNGEITLNGTATANAFVSISTNNKIIFNENTSYTISAFNSISNSNVRVRINSGGQLDTILNSINKTQTINTNSYTDMFSTAITIRVQNGTTLSNFKLKPMLEKETETTTYAPYKTPIELCKIGNYQDKIFKSKGKQLFDKGNINLIDSYYVDGTGKIVAGTNNKFNWVKLEPNKTYTLSQPIKSNVTVRPALFNTTPIANATGTVLGTFTGTTPIIQTFTTTDTYIYFGWVYCNTAQLSGHTQQEMLDCIMINEGSSALPYEPYNSAGKWLLHKEIGKIVLNSSKNWSYTSVTQGSLFRTNNTISDEIKDNTYAIFSNYYKGIAAAEFANRQNNQTYLNSNNNFLDIIDNRYTNVDDFKTWLSTHNTEVYYVLAIPSTTEITDTELINQLKAVELLEGMNNISILSGDLSTPLGLTYLSEMDTIDEEYLKDVNVNFGEKFGPVNSVVLSRAAESDSIYQMDEESVEQNGLTEVKIKDNQILNGNNRDEFLPSIFEKLNGLEYYLTDFSSTGVTYYDLLDKYKINVFDNSYKTIMLNNEVDITQGLEEQIYADRLEESETDYTKSDKTDRKINQAYIIVDKQNQQINSVVQNINTLQSVVNNQGEQVDALGTRLTQTVDNITASVTSIEGQIENGVNLVKTTSVIIDDSGLNVSTDNSKISTTMTNNSFEIKDSGDNMLAFFGYDETENISKSQMDNLTVTNYFVSGYHRTEKFERNGEKRTGHFYIG